jgi:hypothetical protein
MARFRRRTDGRNAWVPQLLVGAVLFWSAVLVLGSLSWRWLRGFERCEPAGEEDSIVVEVREDPGEAAGTTADEPPASERDTIGRTAY